MDAKVDDWIVTPRPGKPVELNALWYNALTAMAAFAKRLKRVGDSYEAQAKRVERSFSRYWNSETGCLFDVLDGPGGHDPAVRPNQLLAVSLPPLPPPPPQRRRVVEVRRPGRLAASPRPGRWPRHCAPIMCFRGSENVRLAARQPGRWRSVRA